MPASRRPSSGCSVSPVGCAGPMKEVTMDRRRFSIASAASAGLTLAGRAVQAQAAWQEGRHYQRLARPVPLNTAPGKVEVTSFFWYGCPN